MKAYGNGTPETCASNLLRLARGEVPYDRVRGRDGTVIDRPNAADDAVADAKWVVETFEPRIKIKTIKIGQESGNPGNFSTFVEFEKKGEKDV